LGRFARIRLPGHGRRRAPKKAFALFSPSRFAAFILRRSFSLQTAAESYRPRTARSCAAVRKKPLSAAAVRPPARWAGMAIIHDIIHEMLFCPMIWFIKRSFLQETLAENPFIF